MTDADGARATCTNGGKQMAVANVAGYVEEIVINCDGTVEPQTKWPLCFRCRRRLERGWPDPVVS